MLVRSYLLSCLCREAAIVEAPAEDVTADHEEPDMEDHDTDSDVAEAWEEFDTGRKLLTRRYARADAANNMPVEKTRGYVELGGKIIGRIATQPALIPNPSIHISCKFHVCCQRWVPCADVPDTRLVRLWMARGPGFDDAADHWAVQTLVSRIRVLVPSGITRSGCVCI